MPSAIIIGGSGMTGRAVARRLLADGWRVRLLGRRPETVPPDLRTSGVEFTGVDREDATALDLAVGDGADLLVDCVCYTARHARALVEVFPRVGSTVMISTKAVYVDDRGNHSNTPHPPDFDGPVPESQATLAPDDTDDYNSRRYGACKVAAEHVLLDSGHPVTVLRPSKIHGDGATKPNEWIFTKRVLDRRPVVLLAGRGVGADHPSAAVNIAALVTTVAANPGRRILNAADPDTPSGLEIARIVARHFGHQWREVLLADDEAPDLGHYPWNRRPPVRLDLSAAEGLGYRPVGAYAETVAPTLDWLASVAVSGPNGAELPTGSDHEYFDRMLHYAAEDAYLNEGDALR